MVAELAAHMNLPRAYRRTLRVEDGRGGGPEVDDALRDALRVLGYVDGDS